MLVTSKELFKEAKEKHFAIPAANFLDMESIKIHVQLAEEMKLPLIIALAESHLGDNINLEDAALIGRSYAKKVKVPIVLHLDHGESVETVKKAVDLGFSSVMIDASSETFEVNVARTKEVVEYAHSRGVVVEAEIGHVGTGVNYVSMEDSDSQYTTVEEAKEFVKETGVDSLAISIGTAHGAYKGIPKINFQRLEEISEAIDTPLVLHGGSSSGDENLNRCATSGISKINIFTDLYVAAEKEIKEAGAIGYLDIRKEAKAGMQKCLRHCYEVFETK